MCLSPAAMRSGNQMQRQEDEVAITEQDLELIKERETAYSAAGGEGQVMFFV